MTSSTLQSLQQLVQAHLRANQMQQARQVLQQIVIQFPKDARAPFMLGVLTNQSGDPQAAIDWLNLSIRLDPSAADPYFIRGLVFQQLRKLHEAVADYRVFVVMKPDDGKGLNNLGRALLDLGQVGEAIEILRRAVVVSPRNAGAWNNLGETSRTTGDLDAAISSYRKAIAVDPACSEAHANLGAALVQNGERPAGLASMQAAVAINPNLFNAHLNLARACLSGGPLDQAAEHCRRALKLRPDHSGAIDLMANFFGLTGQLAECVAWRRRAIELESDNSAIHSNLLMTLHYLDDVSASDIVSAHLDWSAKYDPCEQLTNSGTQAASGRLRIGYVSPNFGSHSVSYFFEPVLKAHDRKVVEIFCYSNARMPDAATARMRAGADQWRDIFGKSDEDVAAMIRQDRIDVLVDLAGHTADNRLPLFAKRPARVQMTWLGYPATTGMRSIQFRLTDSITDPPGSSERFHSEQLVRIAGGGWAYWAPESPPVGPLPAVDRGRISFGSFNNVPKVTPRVLESWSRILHATPGSRLILKAVGLGSEKGRAYVQSHLHQCGIEPHRIELMAWTPTTTAHLQQYNRVDIALDTFPYNGTTTTCECFGWECR